MDPDADRNENTVRTQEAAVEKVPASFQEEMDDVGFDGFGDCFWFDFVLFVVG